MNKPALLRWTRFASDPHGTGGEKRSAQIRAVCEAAGFTLVDMQPAVFSPRWRSWLAGLRVRGRWGAQISVDHANVGLLGYRARFYHEALARHRGAKLLLWETTYDSLLPKLARAARFAVIALPHNLEAFVSEAVFSDPQYDPFPDLGAEVARLAHANAIFTISKEERWLLETRGLQPYHLPFFPDPVLREDCRRIRRSREAAAATDGRLGGPLLILGSGFNPATARGMQCQLEWLARAGLPPDRVVVAGPKTDVMLADSLFPGVRRMGMVPRETLEDLFTTCSALLLHTTGGAGALMRIPEALLAGVPVIANSNAARDQYGTAGVHVYDDLAEFLALARNPPPLPPPPPQPSAAEARFTAEIGRLLKIP
jgi:glycosyltransferase involved in cell wall biosynthesis